MKDPSTEEISYEIQYNRATARKPKLPAYVKLCRDPKERRKIAANLKSTRQLCLDDRNPLILVVDRDANERHAVKFPPKTPAQSDDLLQLGGCDVVIVREEEVHSGRFNLLFVYLHTGLHCDASQNRIRADNLPELYNVKNWHTARETSEPAMFSFSQRGQEKTLENAPPLYTAGFRDCRNTYYVPGG